jgi:hypothetical protein
LLALIGYCGESATRGPSAAGCQIEPPPGTFGPRLAIRLRAAIAATY